MRNSICVLWSRATITQRVKTQLKDTPATVIMVTTGMIVSSRTLVYLTRVCEVAIVKLFIRRHTSVTVSTATMM